MKIILAILLCTNVYGATLSDVKVGECFTLTDKVYSVLSPYGHFITTFILKHKYENASWVQEKGVKKYLYALPNYVEVEAKCLEE